MQGLVVNADWFAIWGARRSHQRLRAIFSQYPVGRCAYQMSNSDLWGIIWIQNFDQDIKFSLQAWCPVLIFSNDSLVSKSNCPPPLLTVNLVDGISRTQIFTVSFNHAFSPPLTSVLLLGPETPPWHPQDEEDFVQLFAESLRIGLDQPIYLLCFHCNHNHRYCLWRPQAPKMYPGRLPVVSWPRWSLHGKTRVDHCL